jgi:DNA topoisomerase-2
MKKNHVTVLSEKTHALKRAGRYLGQISEVETHRFHIANVNNKKHIIFETLKYVPAYLKIIREFLDNSIDEAIRTSFKFANKIDLILNEEFLQILDNGRGIPIVPTLGEDGEELDKLMPESAWTALRAGSNFDDEDDNTSIGQNGEGASLGVFFASKFIGETHDGTKSFKVTAINNLETKDIVVGESKRNFTRITYYPDKEKLNLGGDYFNIELYQQLLEYELAFLSLTYPEITFSLNKKRLKIKKFRDIQKEYLEYSKEFLGAENDYSLKTFETDNFILGVSNNVDDSGYNFIHFVNGINVYQGGAILEWAEKKVIDPLVERVQKRYKNIKTADIKNKITFIVIVKNIPNPRFGDQIKSVCVNKASQFPEIAKELNEVKDELVRFVDRIYKDKVISGPIIDLYKANQLVQEAKKAKIVQKKTKTPAKYWPASKKKKRLFLSEGDSAINPIIAEIGRDENGFFPLKGKLINCLKKSMSMIIKNDEVIQLAGILGIDLSKTDNGETKSLEYEEIWIAGDADVDGSHVVLLVLSFIEKFAPVYLNQIKVFRFITPVMIALKKDLPVEMFFTLEDYSTYRQTKNTNGISWYYAKGLGSLAEEHWEFLFKKYPLEKLGIPLTFKDTEQPEEERKELYSWLTDDIEFRKVQISNNIADFDLDKA